MPSKSIGGDTGVIGWRECGHCPHRLLDVCCWAFAVMAAVVLSGSPSGSEGKACFHFLRYKDSIGLKTNLL